MSTTSVPAEKVIQDLKILIRDSEELLSATAEQAGEHLKGVRARLSHALTDARATCHTLEGKAIEKAKEADQVIRRHPYESIGIAFGVGVLLGLVIGRGR
jgi:ElaB/YqjD/DUF883 family membrane-anchored ribosome-binding protein